jgi:hypothetical protein
MPCPVLRVFCQPLLFLFLPPFVVPRSPLTAAPLLIYILTVARTSARAMPSPPAETGRWTGIGMAKWMELTATAATRGSRIRRPGALV